MSDDKRQRQNTVDALHGQLEQAVDTTVARRREGSDDAALTETVIAVRTAQAIERLTGNDWHDTLEKQVERFDEG